MATDIVLHSDAKKEKKTMRWDPSSPSLIRPEFVAQNFTSRVSNAIFSLGTRAIVLMSRGHGVAGVRGASKNTRNRL